MTLRALNRATLARQMLLAREKTTAPRVIERLIGLQAQWPKPPFIGIWSRTKGFRREDLANLLLGRKVIRATTMRGTIHVMTAKDYVTMRAAIQPALTHGTMSLLRSRVKGVDMERLVAIARTFFEDQPGTFDGLRAFLAKRYPKADIRAMAYFVRTHLPLVLVPTEATWSYPASSDFALAESWLGEPLANDAGPEALVLRYLAAFGPAAASDAQIWSGLPPPMVRDAFEALRPKLIAFLDERGKELFDLPNAPRPREDSEAPVRFLPEFDNLLLAHVDRKRFVADKHRRFVYLPALRVAGTFLADGFVAGTWNTERKKDAAALIITPFTMLPKAVRANLTEEGEALLHFIETDARTFAIRFAKADG